MAAEEKLKKLKTEKKERKKKNKEVPGAGSSKRARWKSECELEDCEMPGVAVGPWPVRISDTSSYVLGQMRTQSWGSGDLDVGDSSYMDNVTTGVELLSNAGVWTEMEANVLYFKKLKRLQRLYLGQVDRLRQEFRLLRRRYLGQLQHIENGGTINSTARMPNPGDDATSALIARRASAIRRYKRFFGHDAVMQHRVRERRKRVRQVTAATTAATQATAGSPAAATAEASVAASPKAALCAHTGSATPCPAPCLPATKYCRQHVCSDGQQCLFVPCEQVLSSGSKCGQPVPGYTTLKRCFLHIDLVPLRCHRSDIEDLSAEWTALHDDQDQPAAPSSALPVPRRASATESLEQAAAALLHDDLSMDIDLARALSAVTATQSSSGSSSVSCLSASVTPPLQEPVGTPLLSGSSVALVSAPLSALCSASPSLPLADVKSVSQATLAAVKLAERSAKAGGHASNARLS